MARRDTESFKRDLEEELVEQVRRAELEANTLSPERTAEAHLCDNLETLSILQREGWVNVSRREMTPRIDLRPPLVSLRGEMLLRNTTRAQIFWKCFPDEIFDLLVSGAKAAAANASPTKGKGSRGAKPGKNIF